MSLLNSELCKQKINEKKWVCAMGWLWAFCQAGWAVSLGAQLTQLPHTLPEAGRKDLYSRTDIFYSTFLKDISPMIKISSGRGFTFLERSHFRSGGKRDHKGKKPAYISPFIISLVSGSKTGLTGLEGTLRRSELLYKILLSTLHNRARAKPASLQSCLARFLPQVNPEHCGQQAKPCCRGTVDGDVRGMVKVQDAPFSRGSDSGGLESMLGLDTSQKTSQSFLLCSMSSLKLKYL